MRLAACLPAGTASILAAVFALAACSRGESYEKRELGGGSFEIINPDGVFRYRSPHQTKEAGIGIRIAKDSDGLQKIVELFPASPAAMAGLKMGDRVLAIDGHPLKGLEPEDAAKRIRGVPGAPLSLRYERNGKQQALTLARAKDAMVFEQFPAGVEVKNLPASGFAGGTCPTDTSPIAPPACHFILQSVDNCYYSCPSRS